MERLRSESRLIWWLSVLVGILIGVVLTMGVVLLLVSGSSAWATPQQRPLNETIPAYQWLFAEGTTVGTFRTFFLIKNTEDAEASCSIEYELQGEPPETRNFTVPAKQRYTIEAGLAGQVGPGKHFGALITCDKKVVAERSMYWQNEVPVGGVPGPGGHNTMGAPLSPTPTP